MEISTGTYQGSDGFFMADAVLSVQAPNHRNFAKIKFGFKRSSETEYTLLTGQSYSGLAWRVRIDGLTPATEYNFIAYSENAHGLLSESENPVLTETMPGGDQLPGWIASITYVDTQDAILQSNIDNMYFHSPTELTVASGAVTVTGTQKFRFHSIDTEGDAATDDLNTISGGNVGELFLIQAENAARLTTLKDGTSLKMEGDFTLENMEDKILFVCISAGVWHEIARSRTEGFPAPTELTIASGAVTVTGTQKFRFHSIDTEGDAATDDLDTISGGNANELILIQAENAARIITLKDGTSLKMDGDFALESTDDKILFICISAGVWHEIARSRAAGFPAPTELTIASSAVTVTGTQKFRFHSIDTEGDAATDNLYVINGGNAGEILVLQAESAVRTVVCKEYTGLKLAGDFTLDNTEDKIQLICISSGVWHELTRSNNGV